MDKKTAYRAARALECIVELANRGDRMEISEDWGGNSLTVFFKDTHCHIGQPNGNFDTLVAHLCGELEARLTRLATEPSP